MKDKQKKKITNINLQKELIKNIFLCAILLLIVLTLSYFISIRIKVKPKINHVTANYISFSNSSNTDVLRITDLSKQSNSNRKESKNKSNVSFNVTGEKNLKYKVIIYPKSEKYDLKNVKFSLKGSENKELRTGRVSSLKETTDGGFIIYQGKIKENNHLNLNMWLTKKYSKNTNLTFEIKIK